MALDVEVDQDLAALFPELTWRPWRPEDLLAIHALMMAAEAADGRGERTSLSELGEFLASARCDPERDTVAAFAPDGSCRAVGRVRLSESPGEVHNSWLAGMVHPQERGRGLGRAILAWEIAQVSEQHRAIRTAEHGPLRLRIYSPEHLRDERALAARFGLTPMRRFVEMGRPLAADEDLTAAVPEGLQIVAWNEDVAKQARVVINTAFRDHFGTTDMSEETWIEELQSSTFRPEWSFVVVDEADGVVAVIISCAYEQDWAAQGYPTGYIDTLATLRSHRGLGLATALIRRSMAAFRASGMPVAGIGVDVDSPTGALRLYESLGFATTYTTVLLARDVVIA